MKGFKKWIYIIMCFIIVTSFIGCTPITPSSIVDRFFTEVKKGNYKDIVKNLDFGDEDIEIDEGSIESMPKSAKRLESALKNITYKINSEKIEGNEAKVNVTVNSLDMSTILGEFMKESFSELFSSIFSGELSEEEMEAKQDTMLAKILEDPPFIEKTGDFELIKKDNEWAITNEKDLIKLLLNIDIDALKSLDEQFGE